MSLPSGYRTPPRWFVPAFLALCLGSAGVRLVMGLDANSRFSFAWLCDGRDAVTYYYATLGAYEGLSPYDREAIIARFDEYTHFVYPLFAVPLFLPLIAFELAPALILFGLAHVAAMAGLLFLWRRLLPIDWRLQAAALPGALGGTFVYDVCSANTASFEALCLWLGIAALWRDRCGRFGVWIALAALPKLLWLSLLPLALRRSRAAWRVIAWVGLAIAALFALWLAVWPETIWQWLANVRVTTSFRLNLFTALRQLDEALGGEVGGPRLLRWESWVYFAWVALVIACFVLAVKRGAGLRSLSLLAPLALLAVWPANLSYSWVPLIPIAAATIFFLAASGRPIAAIVMAVIGLLPQPFFVAIGFNHAYTQGTMLTVLVFWTVLNGIVLRHGAELEAWLGGARARR